MNWIDTRKTFCGDIYNSPEESLPLSLLTQWLSQQSSCQCKTSCTCQVQKQSFISRIKNQVRFLIRGASNSLLMLGLTLVGCGSPILQPASTPTLQIIPMRIFATTSVAPLLTELTLAYQQVNPAARFEIQFGNYRSLFERLLTGEVLYMLTNHLPPVQVPDYWAAPVGIDGAGIIVHPENPITNLTLEQLRLMYEGELVNWSEVGGHDAPIQIISREDGSGLRAEFDLWVMGNRRTTLNALIAPSSQSMFESVAQNQNAVGYLSLGYLGAGVKPVAIEGVEFTHDSLANNSYPLRSFVYFLGMVEPSEPEYRTFFAWVQSPEGQAIVDRHYASLLAQTLP